MDKIISISSINIFILIFFLSACSDNKIFNVPTGEPIITAIGSPTSFPTDTVRLSGDFLPSRATGNYVVLADSVRLSSFDCLKWNAKTIEFILPDTITSGKVFCVFGTDTSTKFDLKVFNRMPFATVEAPPGTFTMGSSVGLLDETPHEVEITGSLIISQTEISQRLYEFIAKSNPSEKKSQSLPVYNVSWRQAIEFCNALSRLDSLPEVYDTTGESVTLDTTLTGWRLPTEAEWEYIARAGAKDDFVGQPLSDYAWYLNNSGSNPHTLGSLKANSFGLLDALGNVREWCWDYYAEDYYMNSPRVNPLGPTAGIRRVSRGGSFQEGISFLRLSARKLQEQSVPVGIRIVRNRN